MALVRRNPAAAFETNTEAAAPQTAALLKPAEQPQASQGGEDTPGKVAPLEPQPGNLPKPAHPVDPGTMPKHPSQASGNYESNGPASVDRTAMVRREANAGAVSTRVGNPTVPMALEELKHAFTVEYDTFDRLKSGAGNIVDSNNNDLGRTIEIQLVSWQEGHDVSPGSDSAQAKPLVRYSADGMTIDGSGQSVNEYLEELRAAGYSNASIKKKAVLVGVLLGAERDSPLIGKTVQVSLSAQSRKTFDRLRFDITLQRQLGKRNDYKGAERIQIDATPRSSNGNNYTLLICSPASAE